MSCPFLIVKISNSINRMLKSFHNSHQVERHTHISLLLFCSTYFWVTSPLCFLSLRNLSLHKYVFLLEPVSSKIRLISIPYFLSGFFHIRDCNVSYNVVEIGRSFDWTILSLKRYIIDTYREKHNTQLNLLISSVTKIFLKLIIFWNDHMTWTWPIYTLL